MICFCLSGICGAERGLGLCLFCGRWMSRRQRIRRERLFWNLMFCGVILINLNRELVVLIDGIPVGQECRMRLRGEVTFSLYPDLITLTIWNLSEQGYHQIRQGGRIAVECGISRLASGVIQDVTRETMTDGVRTEIGFSPIICDGYKMTLL